MGTDITTEIVGPVLMEAEAVALTAEIDRLTGAMDDAYETRCELMLQAKEGCVWLALDLGSWQDYVKQRVGMSRSNSYRMLAVGRVNREVSRGETDDEGVSRGGTVTTREAAKRERKKPEPEQLSFAWAVPHSQDAAKIAHDDIAAKLGIGPAKSFLRDEMTRLSKGALAADPVVLPIDEPMVLPCTHPKAKQVFNGTFRKCGLCDKVIR